MSLPLVIASIRRHPARVIVSSSTTWDVLHSATGLSFSGLTAFYRPGLGGTYYYGRATKELEASTANNYFELVIGGSRVSYNDYLGIATGSFDIANAPDPPSSHVETWMVNMTDGDFQHGGDTTAPYMGSCVDGDVIGVLVKNGKLYFRKNGTWANSADPIAETGAIKTGISGLVVPAICLTIDPQMMTARFDSGFSGSLPSGTQGWV